MNSMKGTENKKRFSKYFLIAAVAAAFAVFLVMIRVFLIPIILAVVLTIIMYPLYKFMLNVTKNKRSLSSLICCIIAIIALLLPLVLITDLVVQQSIELYRNSGPQIEEITQKVRSGMVGRVVNSYAQKWFFVHDITIEVKPLLFRSLDYLGSATPKIINQFSRTTMGLLFSGFVIIFSLFYFLRDGDRLVAKMRDLVPINRVHKERIITGFHSMSNAIIKGIFLIAFLQSILATLTLWAFGIKSWLLWGMITLVLSVIPFVGTGAILVPAGIIKIVMGDVWQGIMIVLISVCFISLIDNVLRPRVIGHNAGMHDLLVFFSIIGGIFTFGPGGLIIGPLIAAVFLSMVEIYKIEFQAHIDASEKN